MASKLGVSRATLNRYEAKPGSVSSDFMRQLARLESSAGISAESETGLKSPVVREDEVFYDRFTETKKELLGAVNPELELLRWFIEDAGKDRCYDLATKWLKEARSGDSEASLRAEVILRVLRELE